MKKNCMQIIWCCVIVAVTMLSLCSCMLQSEGSTIQDPVLQNEQIACIQCMEKIDADDVYCRYCGHAVSGIIDQTEPTEIEFVDYSNFGFIQTFGMTEWVRIEECDFSNHDNASVTSSTSGNPCLVINFANNYIEVRAFNSNYVHEYEGHFLGDRTDGTLDDTYPYQTVSNYVLELQTTNNKNVEITEFQIIAGIPIVLIDAGSPAHSISGYYIPTYFIDWSREPITEGNLYPITYFLKPECVHP